MLAGWLTSAGENHQGNADIVSVARMASVAS